MKNESLSLTEGSVFKNLIRFSLPFLLSSFLQTFYGLADLFVIGQFYNSDSITAVSIGSQLMHMLTVVIVGLSMGTTVAIGHAVGAASSKEDKSVSKIIGNTLVLFLIFALVLTIVLFPLTNGILQLLSTPAEAFSQTRDYLMICFGGCIFISAYNVISSIYRGIGDSKTPMYFVALAGVINIALDFLLIGGFSMGAKGAAIATVFAQAMSALLSYLYARKHISYFKLSAKDFSVDWALMKKLLYVGFPIAAQDGFIQIAFLVITAIANGRGVEVAAAVGIVEKLISFMFLVPSAMLSSVSAIAAQSAGAKDHRRAQKTLLYGILSCIVAGLVFTLICELNAPAIIALFDKTEPAVINYGAQYLRSYVWDCVIAGVHFCFSGYFCAYEKSLISFIHNVASIVVVRIPGAYLAAVLFPATLFPMGCAAPLGSLFSVIICVVAYYIFKRKGNLS